jgi:hypothetical protein
MKSFLVLTSSENFTPSQSEKRVKWAGKRTLATRQSRDSQVQIIMASITYESMKNIKYIYINLYFKLAVGGRC